MTEQELQRQEQKKFKQTDRLIKAVTDLDKRFKKEQEETKKSSEGALSFKNILKTVKGRASAKIRETFSVKNALSMLGMGEGTMIGGLASMRELQKEEKNQEVEKAQKFASGFTKYTEKGRALALLDENKAIAEGVKLYEKRKKLEQEIAEIEAEMKAAKELGSGAKVSKDIEDRLKLLQKENENLFGAETPMSKPASSSKMKTAKPAMLTPEELGSMRESLIKRGNVLERAVQETENLSGTKMSAPERESLAAGVRKGMDEELLKLNEEQLDELRKLVKSFEQSEEDKLESNIKSASPFSPEKKVVQEETKKDNIMSKLVEGIKNFIPAIGSLVSAVGSFIASKMLPAAASGVASLASGAARLLPALAKGAGLIGAAVSVGSGVNDLMEGKRQTTLEGMDIIDPFKVGAFAGEKIRQAGTNEQGTGLLDRATNVVGNLLTGRGFTSEDPAEIAKKQYEQEVAIKKMSSTSREAQSQQLQQNIDRAKEIEVKKEKAEGVKPSATVVNNNVVNNNTSQTKISPPVRNVESSFNARMRTAFV